MPCWWSMAMSSQRRGRHLKSRSVCLPGTRAHHNGFTRLHVVYSDYVHTQTRGTFRHLSSFIVRTARGAGERPGFGEGSGDACKGHPASPSCGRKFSSRLLSSLISVSSQSHLSSAHVKQVVTETVILFFSPPPPPPPPQHPRIYCICICTCKKARTLVRASTCLPVFCSLDPSTASVAPTQPCVTPTRS